MPRRIRARPRLRATAVVLFILPVLCSGRPATAAPPSPPVPPPAPPAAPPAASRPEQVTVSGISREPPTDRPAGQTTYGADRASWADTPARSVAAMVATIPGVSVLQGNGPRDTVV
ncbi:MAG: hypothetical protein INR65_18605, partial [Gluconacetobacter diazotrophicus]|nr:hypothetical protein [Gluconacetobacter diazotrophicus]